jgi:hypothetical protein
MYRGRLAGARPCRPARCRLGGFAVSRRWKRALTRSDWLRNVVGLARFELANPLPPRSGRLGASAQRNRPHRPWLCVRDRLWLVPRSGIGAYTYVCR